MLMDAHKNNAVSCERIESANRENQRLLQGCTFNTREKSSKSGLHCATAKKN